MREIHLRDWPFGAVGRRLLLEALLFDEQPERGWTKQALERKAEVQPGGLDEVLAGALELRLIEQHAGRWQRPGKLPPLAKPLKALIAATLDVPDKPIPPLPRRSYRRHTKGCGP
jgi:hypothetical protein